MTDQEKAAVYEIGVSVQESFSILREMIDVVKILNRKIELLEQKVKLLETPAGDKVKTL
jgi:hypothetical protein